MCQERHVFKADIVITINSDVVLVVEVVTGYDDDVTIVWVGENVAQ